MKRIVLLINITLLSFLFGDNFSIDNNTSSICDQYENYTSTMYADITEGQSYTIDITLSDCSGMNYSSGGKVYIDWNIDGDFDDVNENIAIRATIKINNPCHILVTPINNNSGLKIKTTGRIAVRIS